MKQVWVVAVIGIGCGDDGSSSTVDAPSGDGSPPTDAVATGRSTHANVLMDGEWVDVGPADWSCLGTPTADQASTGALELSGHVEDYLTGNGVTDIVVEAFPAGDLNTVRATATSVADGAFTLSLPQLPPTSRRWTFRLTGDGYLETWNTHLYFAPNVAPTTRVAAVTQNTVEGGLGFVAHTYDSAKMILFGDVVDCGGRRVSGTTATVSTTSGTLSQAPSVRTFYIPRLMPVQNAMQPDTSNNGSFIITDIAPAATAYVQIWGFKSDADLGTGTLSLLSELPIRAAAENVITTHFEPRRT